MRIPHLFVAFATLAAGCSTLPEPNVVASDTTASVEMTRPTAALDDLPVMTWPEIDSEAILAASGFQRCLGSGIAPGGDTSADRGQEIVFDAVEAGIGQGGSPGGDGTLAMVDLFVLDEASLATLATFADPSELCITGADPNDFVALGPQQLSGPGWRWVGAGSTLDFEVGARIVDDQAAYDELWSLLGEGPETDQIPVDFDSEVILAYSHGSGVNFGACGVRFDRFGRKPDGLVVLDFFRPGGDVSCDAISEPSIYTIALERRFVGEIPFAAAVRSLPRAQPQAINLTVGPPTTTTIPEPTDDDEPVLVPTTEPPVLPTAPTAFGDFAAGTISVPMFPNRTGSTEPGEVDLPVPEAWESNALTVSVSGRGGLWAATFNADDPAWRSAAASDQLEIVDGPIAFAVPLYRVTADGIVTTGESASVQQYRYGSDDPNEWLRSVVWVISRGDRVTVAVLSYPEFPGSSDFDNEDPLQTSLTGQDPLDIMNDIRLFSTN